MERILYFIGAGLTKSLALPTYPVPTMSDFISTCAEYVKDDVVRVTLAVIENSLPYPYAWESDSARSLAQRLVGPDRTSDPTVWSEFARALRDRPSESIEDLLDRTGDMTSNRYSHDVEERFRYAIGRLFAVIGWNIEWGPLTSFLTRQLRRADAIHTFISFNYDLVLERGLQLATEGRIDFTQMYGFPISWQVTGDPPSSTGIHGAVSALPVIELRPRLANCELVVLKPHGSLNWLVPIGGHYDASKDDDLRQGRSVIIPLGEDGSLRYLPWTELPPWVRVPNDVSIMVEPVIVTPRGAKKPDRRYLRDVWAREEAAVLAADEVYVLGWSIPRTDKEQECLIRYSVGKRSEPFQQITAVNLSAGVDYYNRVQDLFGVERKAVRAYDAGFREFAATR